MRLSNLFFNFSVYLRGCRGYLYLRFSPRLSNGAITRKMTVKARPNPAMNSTVEDITVDDGTGTGNMIHTGTYLIKDSSSNEIQYTYTKQEDIGNVQRGESLNSTEVYFGANKITFEVFTKNGVDYVIHGEGVPHTMNVCLSKKVRGLTVIFPPKKQLKPA